jgi:hypothetical protein
MLLLVLPLVCAASARPQAMPYARTFPRTRAQVDQALKEMGAYAGQKLPIVDGFVAAPPKPMARYERAFYQLAIDLFPGTGPRGGTIVQVSAKITAWYADSDPSKSGYEVLVSNGRLEFDLLDRLDEKLGTGAPGAHSSSAAASTSDIAAPKAKLDLSGVPGVSQLTANTGSNAPPSGDELKAIRAQRQDAEKQEQQLTEMLQNLEDVKKNQAHPLNLVVVRKNGTPITGHPVEGSHVLFTASEGDEFEFLDAQGAWLHVGISGVSRGYLKRSAVEVPEFVETRLKAQEEAQAAAQPATFQIEREEVSPFPGDWQNLRGQRVKIYTVQPVSADAKETDARAKLIFAAGLFRKFAASDSVTADAAGGAASVRGVVVIYDSADGGIIGATLDSVKQLAANTLPESEFWKNCYFDPPEAFRPGP